MASSWRLSKRGFRPKASISEDYYRLDPKKSPAENTFDIYQALCSKGITENKRLSLLNAFVTIFQQGKDSIGFTTEELLYCLSASLTHSFTQVRAASLRAIRYLITTSKDIQLFNALQIQNLVCRSLDILLKNEDERVQALKLIRKMLAVSPDGINPVLVRCLVSLGDSGAQDGDRMLRACLATLCEFGVLNPTLLIFCGGVGSITRNLIKCYSPRIAESLCGVLLHLLEWPHTRNIAGVNLDCLAAPYCDFTYRLGIMDKNKDARELRYTSSRLALLSILRSWAGTIEFCDPNKSSGLKSIVDVLYLNQLEVRKAILDLLYELLELPQPIWTDEYSVALSAVDPSDFQDSWLLTNGFVAMEGRCILPSLASKVPNVCEQHLALLLYCFLETGLINALIEVIVSSDTFLSVRATILIGKLLQLMHTHLPADICSISPALPTLIAHATRGNHQANSAVSALQNLNQMLKNRPASCSLFLDNIIQGGALVNSGVFKREINAQETSSLPLPPLLGTVERKRHDSVSSSISGGGGGGGVGSGGVSCIGGGSGIGGAGLGGASGSSGIGDESFTQPTSSSKRSSLRVKRKKIFQFFESLKEVERLMKESNVLSNQDANTWDWEIIIAILRSDAIGKLDDTKLRFIRRLIHYFKPSSNRFSHQDLSHGRNIPSYVTAGLDLIDWLLQSSEFESVRLLTDLFSDVSQQLLAISTSSRAHDCLFSPQHMSSTMCQQYFLFIGRMCRCEKGLNILTNTTVFTQLQNLVTSTDHVCYVKLIVSGLDYGLESYPRKILEKALTQSKTRNGRLYATQFMLVLLRAKIPNFEVWGIPMLIKQTKDPERSVILAAMEILDEACHDRTYLEEIVSIWPDFKPLGDVGKLLMARYYSIPRGLNHQNAKISDEIEFWKNNYNKRYVLVLEADTHSSLTLHIKNENGLYSKRSCSTRPIIIPPNIPPHLYGQLIQTEQGTKELHKHAALPNLIETLTMAKCSDENECLELKATLWALGHISTNSDGVKYLCSDSNFRVYEKMIYLAKYCEVYSIRSTAFSVLGLVGCTNVGANILFKLDWFCVRHDRNTLWPVCEPEDWLSNNLTPIRHHYEDVPPYNYTGIDENINGFNTSTDSNSFFLDENESKASSKDEYDGEIGTTARSRTLPESNSTRYIKHTRSLSESKTTDVLSLINGTQQQQQQQHRTRFNSGTDSNTSGVSSCESVFGRNLIGEIQQTQLSPIPSTSNLLEIPSSKDRFKRVSLIGTSLRENYSLSPQDIQGYATLRSLRKHSRPVLSESAADELAEIIDRDTSLTTTTTTFRTRKLSIGGGGGGSESQRKMKVRSLDRHSTQLIPRIEEFQVPLPTLTTPKFLSQNDSKGPCYSGICLPKNILDLFPVRNLARTYVSRDIDLIDFDILNGKQQQFLNDSLNEGDESSISSLSDISSASKRTKTWIGKHNRSNCLHCSRTRTNRLQHSIRTDSDINIFNNKRKSNYNNSSSVQLSDISFNSPESILSESENGGGTGIGTASGIGNYGASDKITANILHHVQRMLNPVTNKQTQIVLLELKQKYPQSFQDICLYSEVCKALGRNTYRMNSRRFLQELFFDLNFESFYNEPNEIIARKANKEFSYISSSNTNANNSNNNNNNDNENDYFRDFDYSPSTSLQTQYQQQQLQQQHQHNQHHQQKHSIIPYPSATTTSSGSDIQSLNFAAATGTTTLFTKTHLKSPPLESVYETSYENLSDSFNNSKLNNIKCNSVSNSNGSSVLTAIEVTSSTLIKRRASADCCNSSSSTLTIGGTTPITALDSSTITGYDRIDGITTATTSSKSIENENKKYTRGRFYTLELDLSCTKNKFPITDRRKNDFSPTTTSSSVINFNTTTNVVTTTTTTTTTKTGLSSASTTVITTAEINNDTSAITKAETTTTTGTTFGSTSMYPQIIFTKSLASSIATPTGSLYCEKRLQSSRSEAVLSKTKQKLDI